MYPNSLLFYQENPVKLKNSVKYNYQYNYCPSYIKGQNNSSQYFCVPSACYQLLNDDPYLRKLPDTLQNPKLIPYLSERSKMIYFNQNDKNWGPQTMNRIFWEQQNKTYHSSDQLLQDKIKKIKYMETKRNNKNLKNANPNLLRNGYYNYGNKTNNWYYENGCGLNNNKFTYEYYTLRNGKTIRIKISRKGKKRLFGNFGINTNVYKGSTYKIDLPNTNPDPIYYDKHNIKEGGDNYTQQYYKYKPNYISTNRIYYDLGLPRVYLKPQRNPELSFKRNFNKYRKKKSKKFI